MDGRRAPAPSSRPGAAIPLHTKGGFVHLDGETFYRIAAYHRAPPFLVSLASDSDLWMFVTSGGGLTAGRVDAERSLFPYLTVDRLHDAHHHTGPVTMVRAVRPDGGFDLWRPFADAAETGPRIERNLYKNVVGNRLVFEEIDHDLALAFRYEWTGCDEYGWVRTSRLENLGVEPRRLEVLDGLRNVLPHGAPLGLYQQASTLVDAYRTSEIDADTGLGLFSLTAGITDRAEALESLTANTVWFCGPDGFRPHLDLAAVAAFRDGHGFAGDHALHGKRGNYLVTGAVALAPGESNRWRLVADVGVDHRDAARLRRDLREVADLDDRVGRSLALATESLRRNVASADGLQLTGDAEASHHHFANVLFNNMRGGVFDENYDVSRDDVRAFVAQRNSGAALRLAPALDSLPETLTASELRRTAAASGDADFLRLSREFLPLHFGRRHGDPSRPWNRFSIRSRDRNGERTLHYEGNWRDIFQNWEALCTAFPDFLPSVVAKFVGASTVDGFNPYRITHEGVDWEIVEPDDPWSNIGYWGDHQIIYLLKLLEAVRNHCPTTLDAMLGDASFSYAEVPYVLKPYADVVRDPSATIDFDTARAARIEARVDERGADGKLLTGPDGEVLHVTLFEKLLVPALSKLSNLIPDAGVWMNTQRPEWNDANNALAGGGVSVVTMCYLRRYLAFLADLLESRSDDALPVSTEVGDWLTDVLRILESERHLLRGEALDPRDRRRLMDSLGAAFGRYRETVYACGFTGRSDVPVHDALALCRTALAYCDWGIRANRRGDGLYHSYNILDATVDGDTAEVGRLQVMLEGQVAAISSGLPDAAETVELVDRLFAGPLYRADQRSFLLYPERRLPGFLERNLVPEDAATAVPLIRELLDAGDPTLLVRDAEGRLRFRGTIRNARDVDAALDEFAKRDDLREAVARDRETVLELFESVFHHRSYTGRSGVMYGYEGLGCIYWHMVAKLLLAVQEVAVKAEESGASRREQDALAAAYYRIRAGLGFEKSVAEYGAFPTDPYSHTPPDGGAKQPGMTGQVKEEILTRRGELGVRVADGAARFSPFLLRDDEFLGDSAQFRYLDRDGDERTIDLAAGSLAFTVCQTPVVYEHTDGPTRIRVLRSVGVIGEIDGDVLDVETSRALFSRDGSIDRITVSVPQRTDDDT